MELLSPATSIFTYQVLSVLTFGNNIYPTSKLEEVKHCLIQKGFDMDPAAARLRLCVSQSVAGDGRGTVSPLILGWGVHSSII